MNRLHGYHCTWYLVDIVPGGCSLTVIRFLCEVYYISHAKAFHSSVRVTLLYLHCLHLYQNRNSCFVLIHLVQIVHCTLFCGLLPAIALALHSSERNCAQGHWSAPAHQAAHQSDHRMQKVGFVVFLPFLRFFSHKSNSLFLLGSIPLVICTFRK